MHLGYGELISVYGTVFALFLVFRRWPELNLSETLLVPVGKNIVSYSSTRNGCKRKHFLTLISRATDSNDFFVSFSSLVGNWKRVLFSFNIVLRGAFKDETGVENMTCALFRCSFTGASSSDRDLRIAHCSWSFHMLGTEIMCIKRNYTVFLRHLSMAIWISCVSVCCFQYP